MAFPNYIKEIKRAIALLATTVIISSCHHNNDDLLPTSPEGYPFVQLFEGRDITDLEVNEDYAVMLKGRLELILLDRQRGDTSFINRVNTSFVDFIGVEKDQSGTIYLAESTSGILQIESDPLKLSIFRRVFNIVDFNFSEHLVYVQDFTTIAEVMTVKSTGVVTSHPITPDKIIPHSFLSESNRLWMIQGSILSVTEERSAPAYPGIKDCIQLDFDKNKSVWVLTRNSLLKDVLQSSEPEAILHGGPMKGFSVIDQGPVLYRNDSLFRIQNGLNVPWDEINQNLAGSEVNCLSQSSDGDLWVATENGLFVFQIP